MKKKKFWLIALSMTLALSTLTACSTPATLPTLSEDEKTDADIYAAVVRQLYTDPFLTGDYIVGELPNFPVVYLVEATNDTVGDPDITQAPSRRLPEPIQVTITAALDDLPTKVKWAEDFLEVPRDNKTGVVKGNGAIITLGNIHFQEDGSALVSASIYIANLAASGRTYIVERVDGVWQVVGDTGTCWIS